ncbi:MAG: acyl carrier protein, partial [Microcystis panniformis]
KIFLDAQTSNLTNTETTVFNMQKHQQEIRNQLKSILALLLKEDENDLPEDETLLNLGADSIILTDFSRKVEEKFQVKVKIDQLFTDLQTLVDIAEYLCQFVKEKPLENASEITTKVIDDETELSNYLQVIEQLQPIATAYIIKALESLGKKLNQGEQWTIENLR